MKKIITVALIGVFVASALSLVVSISGCGPKETNYGQPLSADAITPIKDILSNPEGFVGETVKVEGIVRDECPAGGWFFLEDETGIIYVNLHPSYFAIPQVIGGRVTAEGRVRKEGPQVEIIGKGVELK